MKPWREKRGYHIFQCRRCGFGQVRPKLSKKEVLSLYVQSGHDNTLDGIDRSSMLNANDVMQRELEYPNSSVDAKRIASNSKRLLQVDRELRALDIGAGYGFFSRAMTNEGFSVTAIESAHEERRIFTEINGFSPINTFFEDFRSQDQFDLVLMSHILEHACNPEEWIKHSSDLMRSGGILVIAVPHFNSVLRYAMQANEPFIIPPYHLNYFTIRSLRKLLSDSGFELILAHTISRLPIDRILAKHKIPRMGHFPFRIANQIFSRTVDALSLGSVLNVYARKR